MSDTALLLRVHYWDDELAALAATLRERLPYDLHIVADETQGKAPPLPYPTIGLDAQFAPNHGLLDRFPQVTWRCGDYALYLARERLPNYRFYWMLEHDVRLHFADPYDALRPFEAAADVDFLSCGYGPAGAWAWGEAISDLAPNYRCAFAIVRLAGHALDALRAERVAQTQMFLNHGRDPTTWPNDEAFVATMLTAKGFVCRDMNDFGRTLYEESSFDFFRPVSLRAMEQSPPDNRIHHPVLHGLHLFNKWMTIAFAAKQFDFDWLIGYVRSLIGVEWNPAQATQLIEHIGRVRTQRPRVAPAQP